MSVFFNLTDQAYGKHVFRGLFSTCKTKTLISHLVATVFVYTTLVNSKMCVLCCYICCFPLLLISTCCSLLQWPHFQVGWPGVCISCLQGLLMPLLNLYSSLCSLSYIFSASHQCHVFPPISQVCPPTLLLFFAYISNIYAW